jgi:hypothetical protein
VSDSVRIRAGGGRRRGRGGVLAGAAAEAADLASSDSVRWAAAAPLGHDARGRGKKRGEKVDRV